MTKKYTYFETSKLPIVIVAWSTLTESFTNLVDLVSIWKELGVEKYCSTVVLFETHIKSALGQTRYDSSPNLKTVKQ